MSLYYEAADLLTAPTNSSGSLKSRIFSKKGLKSQPAQIYALAIETCKWSSVLKEVVENADILRIERKLTPILSLLLVHDLLLAKRGIALPAIHGLRSAVERHKGRIQAEFTKARIRRKLSSVEALKAFIEEGLENSSDVSEAPYPRWVRINTLKTTLEDQLETTFASLARVNKVEQVRKRGSRNIFIDGHIPNLVAISPSVDLTRSEAYKSGAIIFQDKASCFPAYLLDPLPEDADIIDTCSAPGNKTTHIAAILLSHSSQPNECSQTIHAFEKNKGRAETLEKMVNVASSHTWTKLHPGQDFLKTNPTSSAFKNVGALLLDPSCSGSGIIGRDEMPELHLPILKEAAPLPRLHKKGGKPQELSRETKKRKRDELEPKMDVMVDDDGEVTAVSSETDLKTRLEALSKFQLELLIHAFKFPAAKKITYSTCSIHAEENEFVIRKALEDPIATGGGWRLLKREKQIKGMKEWPVRGMLEAAGGDEILANSCIRANKEDEHGTMGFFLAGFVRDRKNTVNLDKQLIRDERRGQIRETLDIGSREAGGGDGAPLEKSLVENDDGDEDEWGGIEDDEITLDSRKIAAATTLPTLSKPAKKTVNKHTHSAIQNRAQLVVKPQKKPRKGKSST